VYGAGLKVQGSCFRIRGSGLALVMATASIGARLVPSPAIAACVKGGYESRLTTMSRGSQPSHLVALRHRAAVLPIAPFHTVEYHPFIKSQLALRNQLEGLLWCKFGHVTVKISNQRNPRTPPSGYRPHNMTTESEEGSVRGTVWDQRLLFDGTSS